MIFKSTKAYHRVTDIDVSDLKKMNIKGLVLDLDNTLTTHDNPKPADGVLDWLDYMKSNGIKLMILSNNHAPRVKPFADMLGLEFVCEGAKPLSKGFKETSQKMGLELDELGAVGDQIFTDILGANLVKMKSLYVSPIEHEHTLFFKFKRKMEIPFLPKNLFRKEK